MKRKLFLVCLFLTSMISVQAQNVELLANGAGEDGSGFLADDTTGWFLGGGFSRGGSPGYYYAETSYISANSYPTIKTDGQKILLTKGATYELSYWIYKLDADEVALSFNLEDRDGKDANSVSHNGIQFNSFKGEETGQYSGGYKEIKKSITFPDNIGAIKQIRFALTVGGKSYVRIAEVSLKGPKVVAIPAPKNLKTKSFQREMLITWDEVSGANAYSVKVGDKEAVEVTGTSYMATGLEPDKRYTISVRSTQENALVAKKTEFTELYTIDDEADRVPYVLLNGTDGTISNPFYIHIYDSNTALDVEKVTVDDTEITPVDGFYSLPVGQNKTLKLKLSDGSQEWELEYRGINIQ